MPAIDLARLRIQAASLAEKFNQPKDFILALNEVLDFYTNRTYRQTQIITQFSIPTYHAPRPVLLQIEKEISPLAESRPDEAIALTKALWEAGSIESRLIAANLVGNIAARFAIPVLTKLPDWLARSTDREVRQALLTDALARVRRENPETFFSLLEAWLASARPSWQVWGMQALIPLLQDPEFENLPAVFRILQPAIISAGPITQVDLQACIQALEKVSFTETLAFLRETIRQNPSVLLVRTFRRILPAFSLKMQAGLRETLRGLGGVGEKA